MTWVKMVNGEIVETTSRRPSGARRLDTLEWVTPAPDADAAVLEPCGWYEAAKTSAPDDGFAYSGAWAVADGRPVWQWTKGDALPEPVPDTTDLERDVVAWDAMVGRALVGAMRSYRGQITGDVVDGLVASAEDAVASQVAELELLRPAERAALVIMRHAVEHAKVEAKRPASDEELA